MPSPTSRTVTLMVSSMVVVSVPPVESRLSWRVMATETTGCTVRVGVSGPSTPSSSLLGVDASLSSSVCTSVKPDRPEPV